jgi:hypothetical protein
MKVYFMDVFQKNNNVTQQVLLVGIFYHAYAP